MRLAQIGRVDGAQMLADRRFQLTAVDQCCHFIEQLMLLLLIRRLK